MLSRKIFSRKIVAILIVLLMTLIECLPIANNIVLAADDPENAVTFNGYFSSESVENASSLICDVSESSLKVNFEISLKKGGYLKNGVVSFKNYLNFNIKEENQIKNNEVKIRQIGQDKSETISFPIEFERQDIYDSDYLSNVNKIIFTATYVDNEAIEHSIEKEVYLKLSWKEENSTVIETNVIKNIDYDLDGKKAKILQTSLKVYGEKEKNNIPVKNSELVIDIPQIPGMVLKETEVQADKLLYTQGRQDYEIDFSETNYRVNNENKLVINTANNEVDGNIYNSYGEDLYTITYIYIIDDGTTVPMSNEDENNINNLENEIDNSGANVNELENETDDVKSEINEVEDETNNLESEETGEESERDDSETKENEINSDEIPGNKIKFTLTNYADIKENKTISIDYQLEEPTGRIVEYTKEEKDSQISKGYLMANTTSDRYEISYIKKDVLNISRSDLVDYVLISDKDEYFVENRDQNIYYTENENGLMTVYKTTELSRDNLINVLGENGKIEILNMNDEVIATVTFDMETNENGSYIINYEAPISKIKIRISKPIKDGKLSIISTKAIKQLYYSRDIIKNIYKLVNVSESYVAKIDGVVENIGEATNTVTINETFSNATLEMTQKEISTAVKNEAVNFKIRLNNNEDTSDLYENPIFEIRLPKAIKEIRIRNIDLFYANNELEIANVENFVDEGYIIIRITLNGLQMSYNLNKETNGTIISFDVDLEVEEFTGNGTDNVEMCYYNKASSRYENEFDWNMYIAPEENAYLKNGISIIEVTFKALEEILNGQMTETKEPEVPEEPSSGNEKEEEPETNKVITTNQGPQAELIQEGVEAKLATMYISIMNNTDKRYKNFQILGRLPFVGNKDILTGRDLGTTVNTLFDKEIETKDEDLLYTVYYSENGEATRDLTDEANGWHTDIYKMGAIKSYLILLNSDYVLEPDAVLEFEYDYVIPAGLKNGDAFYGTYATYYEEESGNTLSSSADEIGYKTAKKSNLEVTINLLNDKIVEQSDAEYEVIIKNTSDVDAEKVIIKVPSINGLTPVYVKSEKELPAEYGEDGLDIYVDLIKANSEERIIVGYNTFGLDENIEQVKVKSTVKAENSDEVVTETIEYPVERNSFEIYEDGVDSKKIKGVPTDCFFKIMNTSNEKMTNVVITKKLSSEVIITNLEVKDVEGAVTSYDQDTGIMRIEIPELYVNSPKVIKYTMMLRGDNLTGNEYVLNSLTTCTSNEEEKEVSFERRIVFYLPDINIKLVNKNDIGYVSQDKEIGYIYEITNNSKFDLAAVKVMLESSNNIDTDMLKVQTSQKEEKVSNYGDISSASEMSIKAGEKCRIVTRSNPMSNGVAELKLKMQVLGKTFESGTEYSVIENVENKQDYKVTGIAYIDRNGNQKQDPEEEVLSGIIVELYNSETNEKVDTRMTDISGRYTFGGLRNGQYYVRFNYDESEYVLSSKQSDTLQQNQSNIISVNDSCMTDNIAIDNKSVSNIDLGLSDENIFDMKIDTTIERMTVQNQAESNTFEQPMSKLAKVDIDPNLVEGSKVLIEYKITVTNQGTIPGKITKIVDYMAGELEFDSSINKDWYIESDGNVYTRALEKDEIAPGESRELRLILIKNMTENNTGLVHNTVEIASCINDKSIPDIDSIPGNQLNEDDLSYADAIIGITTGLSTGVLPIVLVAIVIIIPSAIFVWRVIDKRRYV